MLKVIKNYIGLGLICFVSQASFASSVKEIKIATAAALSHAVAECRAAVADLETYRAKLPSKKDSKNKDKLFITRSDFDEILNQLKQQNGIHLTKINKNLASLNNPDITKLSTEISLYQSNCNRVVRDTKSQIAKQPSAKKGFLGLFKK